MEIKGNVSNSITYEGKLTLKYRKNNKVFSIKNTGTQALTNLIVKALCNVDISNSVPKFLGFNKLSGTVSAEENENGGNTLTTNINSTTVLRNQVPFTGIIYNAPEVPSLADEQNNIPQSSIKLTATILPTDILNSGVGGGSFELVMYSRDGKTRLATIKDDSLSSMYQAVCNGVEAIIEWEMIFKCVK